ncbi:unnamed protein product [Symbiodinium necroappetens]|uniref:Uncharacterized protein n=1 Tax=Symbiodinium necroappetens TaxID=1628268 RepID=A0A812IT77_9DINO|nr:unnamed protein product [Symbiodinium necroappetens]
MMSLDQWDWKTSAPEFVPGVLHGVTSGPLVGAWVAPHSGSSPEGQLAMGDVRHSPMCAAPGGPVAMGFVGCLSDFGGHGAWQAVGPVGPCQAQGGGAMSGMMAPGPCPVQVEFGGPQPYSDRQEMMDPLGSAPSQPSQEEDYAERIRAAQLQARYEQRLKSKDQELRYLQERLNRQEDETAKMQAEFERDRQGLLYNLNQLSHVVATERKGQTQWGDRQGWSKKREKQQQEASVLGSEGTLCKAEGRREGTTTSRSRLHKEPAMPATGDRRDRPPAVWRPQPSSGTLWSGDRFEKFARQTPGAFELREKVDGSGWTLRLRFEDLSPPLNDEGMQVFCRWLHQSALQRMREEKLQGLRSMRTVEAEVSFAWNYMGDEAVGRLLQALQRSELRVATLNFSGNCLGPAGASHVCDFLQEASFGVREISLSHNLLDEAVVMELLGMLSDHPKYPLRRHGKADPVKLLLSNNGLHAAKLLKKIGGIGGLSLQSSRTRSARDWHVLKNGVDLLKLPDFEMQEQVQEPGSETESPLDRDRAADRKLERNKPVSRVPKRSEALRAAPSPEVRGDGPGVPEQTPEPDVQTQTLPKQEEKERELRQRSTRNTIRFPPRSKLALEKAGRHYRDRLRNGAAGAHRIEEHPNEDDEDEEVLAPEAKDDPEDDELPISKPAVRITAPPKILQRENAVVPTAAQAVQGGARADAPTGP